MYEDIKQEEVIKGLKFWQNPKNNFNVLMLHYCADPCKDPSRQGKEWYDNEKKGALKHLWKKEMEIDFTTKAGKLIFGSEYCDFDKNIHFINSFEYETPVEQLISLDFGQRNPTATLVGIWTMDNVLYIIDEYYKPAIPSVSSREMFNKFGYLMDVDEETSFENKKNAAVHRFGVRVIDPSTRAKNRVAVKDGEEIEYSVVEEFEDNGWEFELGSNDVPSGITRIREYFKLDEKGKSHLYIFKDKCPKLCEELEHYRYKEHTEIQAKTRNKSEDPVKKNDHAVDALRYMIMTRPNSPSKPQVERTRIQKDIDNLLRPKIISNNWDVS